MSDFKRGPLHSLKWATFLGNLLKLLCYVGLEESIHSYCMMFSTTIVEN